MPEKPLSALKVLSGDDPITKRRPATPPPTAEQLDRFANFAGTPDVKGRAAYLSQKGLIGANQLLTDHPDLSTTAGIINSQSDWKTTAMAQMLHRARKAGLRTPTEIKANREALISALHPRLRDAIKHPAFNIIHKNWWETFDSVLADRYAAEGASQPLSSLATALAKK